MIPFLLHWLLAHSRRRVGLIIGTPVLALLIGPSGVGLVLAADEGEDHHFEYIYGVPAEPTYAWTLASGCRIYDNWMSALETDEVSSTHPTYPAEGKKSGTTTWRCKECHGWDYKGSAGAYGTNSHYTGIKGIRGYAGKEPDEIVKVIMDDTHGYTHDMIPMNAMRRLSIFVSQGQVDTDRYIGADKAAKGDPARGAAMFQNVCATCHGFDGRAQNWGEESKPEYVGTEAQENPWEVLQKIRCGHPGHEMPALMALPIGIAVDILSHAQTLPAK